jgi:WD40 repeat protein
MSSKLSKPRVSCITTVTRKWLIRLWGLVLILAVSAMSNERSQSKQTQREQRGVIPILSLSDANRPLLSYDGQRIVVMPEVGVVEVYETLTKRKLQTFRVPDASDYAIDADGSHVGIWGSSITRSDDRHYKSNAVFWLFEVDTGKEVRHNDAVIMRDGVRVGFLHALHNSENVSSDLKLVANIAPSEKVVPSVTMRNLETLELVRQFSFGEYSKSGVAGTVAMTPDAKVIAATRRDLYGSNCKQTVVWDATTGRELLRLPFEATGISLSGDGRRLAIKASQGDNHISEVWSLENGKRISEIGLEFGPHRYIITGGILSQDGKLLATTRRNYLLLWDVDSGRLAAAQPVTDASDDSVRSLSFSGDGRFVTTATLSEEVRVWQVAEILKKAQISNIPSFVRKLSQ